MSSGIPEGLEELGEADALLDHVGAEVCDVRQAGELRFLLFTVVFCFLLVHHAGK